MNDIQIVPIALEHIVGFQRCLDAVARERAYLLFVKAPPLSAVREFVQNNIEQKNPQLIALHQGIVIGWCDISPKTRPGLTHTGSLGIGVHQNFRGQGLGTRLMHETIAAAKAKGLERIELEVFAPNQTAIALYEKLGFQFEGIKKNGRKVDDRYEDIVMMALWVGQ